MSEPSVVDPQADDAPLAGVTVIEIEGELTPYAGRLLADLGAVVTRVGPVPTTSAPEPEELYLHRGKHELPIDLSTQEGAAQLDSVLAATDVLLQSGGADAPAPESLAPARIRATHPHLVHGVLTPFGLDGPRADWVSTDLVRLAAGGLLWLGGYPDTEPVAPFGDQSTYATAVFGAVGVLLALIDRDATGEGATVEVSSQEVLTQALETSLPEFELTGKVRRRLGDVPREAGTGIYPCSDGYVSMVAGRLGTAAAWRRLREWLVEERIEGADGLLRAEWEELAHRQQPESIARFAEVFGVLAAARTKHDLYIEAQRRNIALAPVNSPEEVLADRQLAARSYFVPTDDGRGGTVLFASPPYRFASPPPLERPAEPRPEPAATVS